MPGDANEALARLKPRIEAALSLTQAKIERIEKRSEHIVQALLYIIAKGYVQRGAMPMLAAAVEEIESLVAAQAEALEMAETAKAMMKGITNG